MNCDGEKKFMVSKPLKIVKVKAKKKYFKAKNSKLNGKKKLEY